MMRFQAKPFIYPIFLTKEYLEDHIIDKRVADEVNSVVEREVCTYASKYQGKRKPTCGCKKCNEIWRNSKYNIGKDI